ncbi:MAG: acyltransferase family protein [Bacteroidota bacterium]
MLQFDHEYVLSGVFWTLGIESQFYLFAPLLAFWLMKSSGRSYLLHVIVYLVLVAWVPFSFYFLGWGFDGRNLLSNLSHFYIGMVGCKYVLENKPIKANNYLLVTLILATILFSNYIYEHAIKLYWSLGSVLLDMTILAAVILHTKLKDRIVSQNNVLLRIFTLLGVISYGIYAWHPYLAKYVPLLDTEILLLVPATIVTAFVCYRVVERPILKLKHHHKHVSVK